MLRDTAEGVVLPVKIIPRAKREEVVGWQDGRLKIKVSAPPEKGEANRDVVHLLSKTFAIPQSKIVLLKGTTSRQKDFLLIGRTSVDVRAVLTGLC